MDRVDRHCFGLRGAFGRGWARDEKHGMMMIVLHFTRMVDTLLKGLSDNWTRDDHKVMWLGQITRVPCVDHSVCPSQRDWFVSRPRDHVVLQTLTCFPLINQSSQLDVTFDSGRESSKVDKLCIHPAKPPPSLQRLSIGPRLPSSSRRLVLHDPHRQHT